MEDSNDIISECRRCTSNTTRATGFGSESWPPKDGRATGLADTRAAVCWIIARLLGDAGYQRAACSLAKGRNPTFRVTRIGVYGGTSTTSQYVPTTLAILGLGPGCKPELYHTGPKTRRGPSRAQCGSAVPATVDPRAPRISPFG